jgi:hypothetical protein
MSTYTVRAEPGGCKSPPFAQLPHDLAADPRLTPVDVRVVAALLFWARGKAAAWPCDRSIASRVGRAVATVQRSLRRLQALGLIRRERVEPSDRNRTGRVIRLVWRVDHPCDTPRSPVSNAPRSSVIDEGRSGRERERQPSDSGSMSPPPAGGEGGGDVPPSAEDVARFREWANGHDPVKARFGRAWLKTAGIGPDPEASPATEHGGQSSQAECPPLPSPSCGVEPAECRPEGPRHHGPTASEAPDPTGPCVPRPEGPRAYRPATPRAHGPTDTRASRTAASGAPGPVGSQARKPVIPKARDADDLAIPWASVLAGLRDRRLGGSRHLRPQGP